MGKKKKKPKIKTQRVVPYSPEQRQLLRTLTTTLEERFKTGAPAPSYPGRIVPGWQPEEQTYLAELGKYGDFARELAGKMLARAETLSELAQDIKRTQLAPEEFEASLAPLAREREALKQILLPEVPEYRPQVPVERYERVPYQTGTQVAERYFTETVQRPLERYFRQELLPKIRAAYAGPSFWSSFRAKAEQRAAEDLASKLAEERAKLMWAEELARRQALERAQERGLRALSLRETLAQEAALQRAALEQQARRALAAAVPRLAESEAELRFRGRLAPEELRLRALQSAFEAEREVLRPIAAALEAGAQVPRAWQEAAAYRRAVESEILQEGLRRWLMGEQVGGQSVWAYSPDIKLALEAALRLLQYPESVVIAGNVPVYRTGGVGGFLGGVAAGMAPALGAALGGKIASGAGKVFSKIF